MELSYLGNTSNAEFNHACHAESVGSYDCHKKIHDLYDPHDRDLLQAESHSSSTPPPPHGPEGSIPVDNNNYEFEPKSICYILGFHGDEREERR